MSNDTAARAAALEIWSLVSFYEPDEYVCAEIAKIVADVVAQAVKEAERPPGDNTLSWTELAHALKLAQQAPARRGLGMKEQIKEGA